MAEPKQRIRRTPDQIVADLEAKIADVRTRAKRVQMKRSTAVRQLLIAVRAIDVGLAAATEEGNATLKKTLAEGREPLAAYLALEGLKVPGRRGPKPKRSRGQAAGTGAAL